MRGQLFVVGILLVSAGVAGADTLPARKAGLWKMTVEADGEARTAEHCVDAATDKKMQEIGQGMMGGACSKNEVKRTTGGYTVDSECTFGGSKMVSKGEFTGDFESGYEGKIAARFNPPFLGKSDSTTKMSAKFVGPCQSGQKPGDIIMEGFTMNINDMGKGIPGMAR